MATLLPKRRRPPAHAKPWADATLPTPPRRPEDIPTEELLAGTEEFLSPEDAEIARKIRESKARPAGERGARARQREVETAQRTTYGNEGLAAQGIVPKAMQTVTAWDRAGVQPEAPQMPVAQTPEEAEVLRSVEKLDKGGYFRSPEEKAKEANKAIQEHRVTSPAMTQYGYEERYHGGVTGAPLRGGATYQVQEGQPGFRPSTLEVPSAQMAQAREPSPGTGYVRLSGYPQPSAEQAQAQGARQQAFLRGGTGGVQAYDQAIAGGLNPQQAWDIVERSAEARAALPPLSRRARDMGLPSGGAMPPTSELMAAQAATEAQRAESGLAGAQARAETEAAPQRAAAETAEVEARGTAARIAITRMTELAETPEGRQQVMDMVNGLSPQDKRATMWAMAEAAAAAGAPPEIVQGLVTAASGLAVETYGGDVFETGGLLGGIWDALKWIVRGRPERRRAVPAGGAATAPGAGAPGGAPAGAAAPDINNIDIQTATPEGIAAVEAEIAKWKVLDAAKRKAAPTGR